jgi:hypothetical protein
MLATAEYLMGKKLLFFMSFFSAFPPSTVTTPVIKKSRRGI